MSNPLAIAAVTATLRNLLSTGLPDLPNHNVTTKPLDKVRVGNTNPDQLNIFLYQAPLNPAWRNMDIPKQVRSGESGQPPLPVNLHYLITAFGKDDDDTLGHRWLGGAMSVLYDHPLLGAQEITDALKDDSGLQNQIERVRITPLALSVDEISKLWTAFQSQYRISAAYEVSVILIDSTRPATSPLPVLRRGPHDRGVFVTSTSCASISDVEPAVPASNPRSSVELGDNVIISGQNMPVNGVIVRFTRQPPPALPAAPETIDLTPQPGGNAGRITVSVPGNGVTMSLWAPGIYTASLVLSLRGVVNWTTNEVPFGLAPIITVAPLNVPAGNVTLTVTSTPRLRDGQRVLLLFADQQIPPVTISNPADTTQPTTLTFTVTGAVAGTYVIRLRVDGVDSVPLVVTGTPPLPAFDPNQTVTIT